MQSGSPIIMLKENMHRAKSNNVDLFPFIIGRKILSCMKHPTDRIIFLRLTGASVIGQFFGGSNTSLFIIDDEDQIIDSFKRSPLPIGAHYIPSINPMPAIEEANPDSSIFDALVRTGNSGKHYAREIFARFSTLYPEVLSHHALMSLNEHQLSELKQCFQDVMEESLNSVKAYILELPDGILALSCLQLQESLREVWSGESMSEAIRRFQGLNQKRERMRRIYLEIESDLKLRREKLEHTIAHVSEDELSNERIMESQLIAQLLLSMPYPALRVHDDSIILHHEESTITIPGMKGKTYAEHAEHYFKKAKNSKERNEIRKKSLPNFRLRLEQVMSMQKALSGAQDLRSLELIHKQLKNVHTEKTSQTPQYPFREFILSPKYVLYIGRNAQNNDQLTTKFAKPNDLWLHARGVSGSHGILRGPLNPPKNILEIACEITAYFSKSRKGTFVPVAYALKKYVRKPKGAGPGSVLMEREEVIMVEPRLPEGTIDS
jgi:predicted ribosome quality control (RQC) complex YloA/Tae2 family protein